MNASQASRPLSSLSIPPSTLSVLLKAGYETVRDLDTSNAEQLAQELSIPLNSSQAIFSQRSTQGGGTRAPLTQPASAVASAAMAARIPTLCAPLDKLLDGGLPRRHILEISGPPGTPKALICVGIAHSFVRERPLEEVIFVDTQNMVSSSKLRRNLPEDARARVSYYAPHSLTEVVLLVNNLSSIASSRPKLGLVILSSLLSPVQSTSSRKITHQEKLAILESLKKALVALAAASVTVVITNQMATKLLDSDGSPATFDTGARAILVPQPGQPYLPSSMSYRVIICPKERGSGVFKLLGAPSKKQEGKQEPYIIKRMLPEATD